MKIESNKHREQHQISWVYLFLLSTFAPLSACQQPTPPQQAAPPQPQDAHDPSSPSLTTPPPTSQATSATPHEAIAITQQDWDHDGLIGPDDRLPWIVNEPDLLFQLRLRDVGFATKTSQRSFTSSAQENTWQRAQSTIPPKRLSRSQNQAGLVRGLGEAAIGIGQHNPLKISEGTGKAMVSATNLFVEPQPTINVTIHENQLKRSLASQEAVEEVGDAAGYLDIELALSNQGVIAGTVHNFSLNVYTLSPHNQHLWRTFNIAQDSASFSPLTLKSHETTRVILRLEGLNTNEIQGLIRQAASGGFYFEVVTGSIQDAFATKSALSDATDEQTALIEIYDDGQLTRRARVSRETLDPQGVLTADTLLKRLTDTAPHANIHTDDDAVQWSVGDDGSAYLSLFHGKRGLETLSPNQPAHGIWTAEVIRDDTASPIQSPLHTIQRGDTLRLSYHASAAQWRYVNLYAGYPQYYRKFRDLFEVEARFWNQFTSLDAWDVNAAELIKREATALAQMYETFFDEYKDSLIVRALYPNMMSSVEQFKAWFDDTSPQHFTKLTLTLHIERINLYVEHKDADKDLSPSPILTLTCMGAALSVPITTKDQSPKPDVYSVEHPLDAVECTWRPFDPIQVQVTDSKLLGDDQWLNISQDGFTSATLLTPKHMLSHKKLNDTSFITLHLTADYQSQTIPQADLAPFLSALTPRVFRNYETDKADPEALALDMMAQPGLLPSIHSATLFEGLYADQPSSDDAPTYTVFAIYNAFRATDFARVARLKPLLDKLPPNATPPISADFTLQIIKISELCEATDHKCASPSVQRFMHLWKDDDALIKAKRSLAQSPNISAAADLNSATQAHLSELQALRLTLPRSSMPPEMTQFIADKLDLFERRLSAPVPSNPVDNPDDNPPTPPTTPSP